MLASMTGTITVILLMLALVPPLRLTALERLLPMPKALKLHYSLGYATVIMGMIHAVIAMTPYSDLIMQREQAIRLLLDPMILAGSLSLIFLGVTVATSHLSRMKHRPWLWLHRMAILGVGLAVVHVLYAWRDRGFSTTALLSPGRAALLVLIVVSSLALAVHFLRPEWLATRRSFFVRMVHSQRPGMIEMTLELGPGRGLWHRGQVGYFRFDCHGPCGVSQKRHPFTVAEIVTPTEMRIVIKAVGRDTTCLQEIMVGTTGEVAGPYAPFRSLHSHPHPKV